MADVTIPTRDGQTVGGFVDEVCRAVEARLRLMVPMHLADNCCTSCERKTVDAGDAIGEIHIYGGESTYYRFRHSRDDKFRLVLSEPEAVEEKTTYEPLAPAPAMLSAVVSLDAVPVHAPPAEGLTKGRRQLILRVGPLYDINTGAHVLDVTDEVCADLAASVGLGLSVPIDHGHELINAQLAGQPHDAVKLFGRVSSVEAVAGVGLFGTPEWSGAGASKLTAEPGLNFFSPSIVGAAFDPKTSEPRAKRRLHSLSMTPTPKQDGAEAIALSSAPHAGGTRPMEDAMTAPLAPAPKPGENVVTLSASDHAVLLAATARVGELEKQVADLTPKAAEAVTLSARLTTLEAERAVDKARAEVEAARKVGKVIGPDDEVKLLALAPDVRAFALSLVPATRPMVEVGHGGKVEPRDESDPAVIREAVRLSKEKGLEYSAALKLAASPAGVQ